MFKSIRMRLTAWYIGVLSVVLAVFGTLVYFTMAKNLYERLDNRLASTADVMVSSLTHEIQEHQNQAKGEEMFRTVLATVHQATFPDYAITVFQGGRLVARKAGEKGQDPLPTAPPERSPGQALVYSSRAGWRSVSSVAQVSPAQQDYLFMLAEPEAATLQELSRIRGAILLAIPLSLMLAALGGWWMARKSLSPVVAMSDEVERITASSLDRRIRAANPEDELGRLGATFNRLLDRLERAFEQQRQFMADAAHELRTPVSIAHIASQLALGQPHRDEADYRDSLQTIEGQTRRLGRLVQDMFLLARADAGPLPLHSESLYLDELVAEVVKDAGLLAQKKSIRLNVEGLKETPFRGDESLLRRLLLVLLDNAFQHTPTGGDVVVQFEADASNCRIKIHDTGPGVPSEDAQRIFERFYRAEKSRVRASGESGGAGLGLAIGRSIAESHGGSLDLISTGPEGSAFQIALPLFPGIQHENLKSLRDVPASEQESTAHPPQMSLSVITLARKGDDPIQLVDREQKGGAT